MFANGKRNNRMRRISLMKKNKYARGKQSYDNNTKQPLDIKIAKNRRRNKIAKLSRRKNRVKK